METTNNSITKESTEQEGNVKEPMPDEERRRILKKLAACAFVAPAAITFHMRVDEPIRIWCDVLDQIGWFLGKFLRTLLTLLLS